MRNERDVLLVNTSGYELGFPLYFCCIGYAEIHFCAPFPLSLVFGKDDCPQLEREINFICFTLLEGIPVPSIAFNFK